MSNIDQNEVRETIQAISRKVFADPQLTISEAMGATDIPGWTSLSFTQLLTEIESTYGFKFKITEIIKMQNIGGIIEATINHLNTQIGQTPKEA